MVGWLTEKLSSRDKVVVKSTRKADCCLGRLSLKKLLLAAFDLHTASHVQWFDVFIPQTGTGTQTWSAEGALHSSLLLTNVQVWHFHSVAFSLQSHLWCPTVAVLRFALLLKRAQRVSLPSGMITAGKIEGLREAEWKCLAGEPAQFNHII